MDFRIQQLTNLKFALENNKDDLCEALLKDMGRNSFDAYLPEVGGMQLFCNHTIKNVKEWAKDRKVDTGLLIGPANSYIRPEPRGVVCVMGAWNFPVLTLIAPVIDAIAAGNSVIIKPSELAPHTSKILAKICKEGLDERFYRCVQGKVNTAIALSNQRFDLITFTGSTEKGKLIA